MYAKKCSGTIIQRRCACWRWLELVVQLALIGTIGLQIISCSSSAGSSALSVPDAVDSTQIIDPRQALAELDALPTPDGADPASFAKLKAGFRKLMAERLSDRMASTPPYRPKCKVNDLAITGDIHTAYFAFTYRNEGDYNQDRVVNLGDLIFLGARLGQDSSSPGWSGVQIADANLDGRLDLSDLTPIACNFGARLEGYYLQSSKNAYFGWAKTGDIPWSESSIAGGRAWRTFLHTQVVAAGYFRVVPYDSSGEGIASDAVYFAAPYPPGRGWLMYGGNPQHTHNALNLGPQSGASVQSISTAIPYEDVSPVAVAPDGTVLFAVNGEWSATSQTTELLALDQSGDVIWRFVVPAVNTITYYVHGITSAPAVSVDGTVYFESNQLYALAADGSLKWTYADGWGVGTPAIGSDGAVVAANEYHVTSLNPDGTVRWIFNVPQLPPRPSEPGDPNPQHSIVSRHPAIDANGTVYVILNDQLYAIDQHGSLKWTCAAGSYYSSPAIGDDGTIYVLGDHGYFTIYAVHPDGTLKWSLPTGYYGPPWSEPAIAADGTIYAVDSFANTMYAINPQGTIKWSAVGGSDGPPAIHPDGKIYLSDSAGYSSVNKGVYVYNPDGSLAWTYTPDNSVTLSPVIGPDGNIYISCYQWNTVLGSSALLYSLRHPSTVNWTYTPRDYLTTSPVITTSGITYIGSYKGDIIAIDHDVMWRYATGGPIHSSPAIGEDGTVYVGSDDHFIYAIAAAGELRWRYKTGDKVRSSPTIGADGTVYVGGTDQMLYALNPDGSLKWSFASAGRIYTSPALDQNGVVYFGILGKNRLYALSSAGDLNWAVTLGGGTISSPTVGNDGTIYIGSYDNKLYAINIDGKIKWTYEAGDAIVASPALGLDGTIYFSSLDDYLYAIDAGGNLKWRDFMPGVSGVALDCRPVIAGDGTLYIGATDSMYSIDSTGQQKWHQHVGGVVGSFAISANGHLVFGSGHEMLKTMSN